MHALSRNFDWFFARLNPSPTFVAQASSDYQTVKGLIEDRRGPAAVLRPSCFLQGFYGQQAAIYTIIDVDIVDLGIKLAHATTAIAFRNAAGSSTSIHSSVCHAPPVVGVQPAD